eukprot:1157851-Amphidinium_carterae.1
MQTFHVGARPPAEMIGVNEDNLARPPPDVQLRTQDEFWSLLHANKTCTTCRPMPRAQGACSCALRHGFAEQPERTRTMNMTRPCLKSILSKPLQKDGLGTEEDQQNGAFNGAVQAAKVA